MKRLLSIIILLFGFTANAQNEDPCYSVNEFISQTEESNPSITKNFVAGWNMFGYPCFESVDAIEAFSSIVDKIILVKNNNGDAYITEWEFNGVGLLQGGEGYLIKMSDTEYGFSFCESINWPNHEGCTDCEALNFNQWANVDDGSCVAVVSGCTDATAFNYDFTANTDDSSCVAVVSGCTDATAFNYDASANTNDSSCIAVVSGCTDFTACN